MRLAARTKNSSSKRWFLWIGLFAASVAAPSASPQDFRSPIILSPYSISFGGTQIGKASAPRVVTVVNVSASPVRVTNIAVTGNFTQTNDCPSPPASLAANGTCQIQVVFKPSAVEACSGALTVSHDAGENPLTVALSGTGASGGSEIAISPSSLDFPAQKLGTRSASQNITVSDPGEMPLLISSIDADGDFTIMPSSTCETLSGPLSANGNCTLIVTFTPLVAGSRDGLVTIAGNAENSPQTVHLTGVGLQ